MSLEPSELILNPDRSVYHLNLLPEDIAHTVILVGDPGRVPRVSGHFDHLEVTKSKREFITHTGSLNGKRLSVISTGIGTDNIDIVLNELDALVNIDFETRRVRERHTSLNLIRIGTSGSIQEDIPVDSIILSDYAMGFDGLLHYYQSEHLQRADMQFAFVEHMRWSVMKAVPYVVGADMQLTEQFNAKEINRGLTATNSGFYAPQGRRLRLRPEDPDFIPKMARFEFEGMRVANLEMETAGIFGLAGLLGHRAASLNCILANRVNGDLSRDPGKAVDHLIEFTLDRLT